MVPAWLVDKTTKGSKINIEVSWHTCKLYYSTSTGDRVLKPGVKDMMDSKKMLSVEFSMPQLTPLEDEDGEDEDGEEDKNEVANEDEDGEREEYIMSIIISMRRL